ncbi:MAG: DUF748 domain-containing protein [Bacteroidales bacterium]|nr:DUF748 domain-containing protein [Bacteroidales bacterium]
MKKGAKIAVWTVGSLLALLLLAALLAAPVARGYINGHGEQLVGRKVHIDGLRFNLFTGHLAVHDLDLYEDNGTDRFAHFDTLDVRARLLPLLAHTVHLKHITLAGLNASVVRSADRFNFQSLIDHFASDEPKTDTTPSDWVIKLYNIRLSHAQLHYRDGAQQWHLPDVNLRVPGFVIGGEEDSQGGLNIAFTHGGRLNINANHDGHNGDFGLQATLTDFALKNIDPLLATALRDATLKGTLGASLRAQGNLDSLMASRISGTVALAGLDLGTPQGSLASLKELSLHIADLNLQQNRYDISRLQIDGLVAAYEQFADGNTLTRLLAPADTAQAATRETVQDTAGQPSAATPLKLHIGQLAISNCHLTYADHTLPDPFRFPIADLSVEASDITTGGDNNARLRATLPGGGKLMANWNGNIDHWKQHQQLFLSVKGLDMKQLSPWAVYYTGQPIEDGVFGLTTRLDIANSYLDNQNKIDIYKATVGSRRKDVEPQQKIPLKTALYILKDKDDKILIDLPVKGNIDSPEFNYMKLVWKTLGQLLVKVATSPARALGNALGLKSENLEFIELQPDQRGLTSEQYHVLGDLATIVKSDSLVALTLELQMADPDGKRAERLNSAVHQYLLDQGAPEGQIHITTGQPPAEGQPSGYAILSEMKID